MARNPAFDGLRAVAALLVLLCHAKVPGFGGGFIGVDVFFVLSGYLITGILLSEIEATGDIALGRFLLRRAARLYPALLLMITAVLIVGPLFWPARDLWVGAVIAALYLADYMHALFYVPVLGHTWSLAVEEHFYLLWPLAVIGLARLSSSARAKVLIAAFIAATLWRLGNAVYFEDFKVSTFRFDVRLSGLLLGAWLAVADLRFRASAASVIGHASLAALAIFTLIATQEPVSAALMQPAIDIASLGLIAALVAPGSSLWRVFSLKPLVGLGLISYSVYLWHVPIVLAVQTYTKDWLIVAAVTLCLTAPIAALSYVYVERPIQVWRRKRFAAA